MNIGDRCGGEAERLKVGTLWAPNPVPFPLTEWVDGGIGCTAGGSTLCSCLTLDGKSIPSSSPWKLKGGSPISFISSPSGRPFGCTQVAVENVNDRGCQITKSGWEETKISTQSKAT